MRPERIRTIFVFCRAVHDPRPEWRRHLRRFSLTFFQQIRYGHRPDLGRLLWCFRHHGAGNSFIQGLEIMIANGFVKLSTALHLV